MKQKSILDVVHESARGLYKSGVINKTTMREYDALCLPEIKDLTAQQIKKIRIREKMSQAVFARLINTSLSTIHQWEQGDKHPRGTSLKLLNMVSEKGIGILL